VEHQRAKNGFVGSHMVFRVALVSPAALVIMRALSVGANVIVRLPFHVVHVGLCGLTHVGRMLRRCGMGMGLFLGHGLPGRRSPTAEGLSPSLFPAYRPGSFWNDVLHSAESK
jgi:hypothetical protein